MNGYHVKIKLCGSFPEISYELVLPEKMTFNEFERAILNTVPLNLEEIFFCHTLDFSTVFFPRYDLIEKHINEGFFMTRCYDEQHVWYELSLLDVVDYEKKHPSIVKCPDDANIKNIQKGLNHFNVSRNRAYDIIISCKSCEDEIKREFHIPERTTFSQLEQMIIVTFDTDPVTFDIKEDTVDSFCRRGTRFHTKNGEFAIEIKGIIYYRHDFPILADYSGGTNPFDLWWEYYPKIEEDNAQSHLDDFL